MNFICFALGGLLGAIIVYIVLEIVSYIDDVSPSNWRSMDGQDDRAESRGGKDE